MMTTSYIWASENIEHITFGHSWEEEYSPKLETRTSSLIEEIVELMNGL